MLVAIKSSGKCICILSHQQDGWSLVIAYETLQETTRTKQSKLSGVYAVARHYVGMHWYYILGTYR